MKNFNYILIFALTAVMFSSCASQRHSNRHLQTGGHVVATGGGISFSVFYHELRPHGRWVFHPQFGQVWIPRNVGRNFHPYVTNGHWVMTNRGNMWVSGYSWGWAPFHYGRWFFDDFHGWAWVPGYEWAPAWVVWRGGAGYYGWAPMRPGVNINVNIHLPGRYWVFVPNRHVFHRHPSRHFSRNTTIIYNRTTIINNTYIINNNQFFSGPSARDFQRDTGRQPTIHTVQDTNNRQGRTTSVNNRTSTVNVYRPDVVSRSSSATRSSSVNEGRDATTRNVAPQQGTTRATPQQQQQNVIRDTQQQRGAATQPLQQQQGTTRGTATQQQQPTRGTTTTPQQQQNVTRGSTNAPQQQATRDSAAPQQQRSSNVTQQQSSAGGGTATRTSATSTRDNTRNSGRGR